MIFLDLYLSKYDVVQVKRRETRTKITCLLFLLNAILNSQNEKVKSSIRLHNFEFITSIAIEIFVVNNANIAILKRNRNMKYGTAQIYGLYF